MRKAAIYRNGNFAGVLTEDAGKFFLFKYDDAYFNDSSKPAVSLTLPKNKQEYRAKILFPFFSNMIAEGANLAIQSRYLKIDERDVLSLLLATSGTDTIGSVTVKEMPL